MRRRENPADTARWLFPISIRVTPPAKRDAAWRDLLPELHDWLNEHVGRAAHFVAPDRESDRDRFVVLLPTAAHAKAFLDAWAPRLRIDLLRVPGDLSEWRTCDVERPERAGE